MDVQKTLERVKELVKKGSVTRIVVKHKDQQILNIPVNVGAVGAVVGLTFAKWAVLAAALATVGFGCTVEVVKADGGIVNVMDEESSRKVKDFASDAVEKVKENIPVTINVDIKREDKPETIEAEVVEADDQDSKAE